MKKQAEEWLVKVWHYSSAANVLFKANHYVDIIAVDLHYALEKAMKSILAFENKRIPKTHDLDELYSHINHVINLSGSEHTLISIASGYIDESYPSPVRELPDRDEIQLVLGFSFALFERVCLALDVDKDEIVNEI